MRHFPLLLVLLLTACGPAPSPAVRPAAAPTPAPAPSPAPVTPLAPAATGAPAPASTPARYDLIVSYTSFGTGTDREAREKVAAVVAQASQRAGVSFEPRVEHWGREGEHDDCYDLSALSPTERDRLIRDVSNTVGTNERVVVSLDAPCPEGR